MKSALPVDGCSNSEASAVGCPVPAEDYSVGRRILSSRCASRSELRLWISGLARSTFLTSGLRTPLLGVRGWKISGLFHLGKTRISLGWVIRRLYTGPEGVCDGEWAKDSL